MAQVLAPPINLSSTKRKILVSNKNTRDEKPNVVARLLDTESESQSVSKSHRIWLSNVVVKRPKNLFNKEWRCKSIMIARLIAMIMVHILAMFGPFTFEWGALWVAVVLYVLTGIIGISFSFHRHLTHKSFTLPKWLEYLFAYFGCLALQDDPIEWVKTHRYHHKFVDSERDPHSPIEGFWYSHINWIFDTTAIARKRGVSGITKDLETQQFYKFMRRTYILHHFALGLLLYAFGGFPYIVWGMGVRTTCVFHSTFCVNSVCHVWGNRAWNTNDLSKNNWWVALLTGGEGWHNNHHAFEHSARHGLEWWQVDTIWYFVQFLEVVGLAKDVKLPTDAHKQRLANKPEGVQD